MRKYHADARCQLAFIPGQIKGRTSALSILISLSTAICPSYLRTIAALLQTESGACDQHRVISWCSKYKGVGRLCRRPCSNFLMPTEHLKAVHLPHKSPLIITAQRAFFYLVIDAGEPQTYKILWDAVAEETQHQVLTDACKMLCFHLSRNSESPGIMHSYRGYKWRIYFNRSS